MIRPPGARPPPQMRVAQKLYEGLPLNGEPRALITYMRTDSHEMSGEALRMARAHIESKFSPRDEWWAPFPSGSQPAPLRTTLSCAPSQVSVSPQRYHHRPPASDRPSRSSPLRHPPLLAGFRRSHAALRIGARRTLRRLTRPSVRSTSR